MTQTKLTSFMSIQTPTLFVKTSGILLLSATIVLSVKYYSSYNQNKKLEKAILLDKKNYSNEMKEIFNRYDDAVIENKELVKSKNEFKKENEFKKDSFSNNLRKNKVSFLVLKENSIKKIKSLEYLLKKQIEENKILKNQIDFLVYRNTNLNKEISTKATILSNASNLTATNIYANGIKIVSNNIIETSKFKKTEQLKVCFTLLENNSILKGNKDIYIQILNPKKIVLNKEDEQVDIGNNTLNYSAKTNIFYDNDLLDVCVFIESNKKDIEKGDYEINIYSGEKKIGSNVFALK
jgi:hypothetical protein